MEFGFHNSVGFRGGGFVSGIKGSSIARCGLDLGRDGFHSVPLLSRANGDRVESVPTQWEGWFLGKTRRRKAGGKTGDGRRDRRLSAEAVKRPSAGALTRRGSVASPLKPLGGRSGSEPPSEPSPESPESIACPTCRAGSHTSRLQPHAAAHPPSTIFGRRRKKSGERSNSHLGRLIMSDEPLQCEQQQLRS